MENIESKPLENNDSDAFEVLRLSNEHDVEFSSDNSDEFQIIILDDNELK